MIAAAILSAALAYGVPPWILDEVARIESRYNPWAVNVNTDGSIDRGLFQINDRAHPFANPWDVRSAARYAARHLRDLRRELGTWFAALAAYNCGIGRFRRGAPMRSIRYARLVLAADPRFL